MVPMIRVLIVDDHPAMRTGLKSLLTREPGIVVCGVASSAREALDSLTTAPDVIVLDYHLTEEDGLTLCLRLKDRRDSPRVLVYSAHSHEGLALPARLAGADGVLDKGAPAEDLLRGIRGVNRGDAVFPRPVPEMLEIGQQRLQSDDLPLLGMLAGGASRAEVSRVMRMNAAELGTRLTRMVDLLKPHVG